MSYDPHGRGDEPLSQDPATRQRQVRQHERATRPYSQSQRAAYGLWWTAIAVLFTAAALVAAAQGSPGVVLLAGVIGAVTGRYAWRLWTWQARRLVFFIVF